MIGSNHAAIGIASGALLSSAIGLPLDTAMLGVAASLWGSLLPDLDQPSSHISSLLPIPGFFIDKLTTHRGLTHQVELVTLGVIAAVALFLAQGWAAPLFLMTGYASHLFADGITRGGIPTMWGKLYLLPRGWRISVGSRMETVVCVMVCCCLMIATYLQMSSSLPRLSTW
jgi:membrane-bound metal-dependent hydrolase YbcI (DUF457 family)